MPRDKPTPITKHCRCVRYLRVAVTVLSDVADPPRRTRVALKLAVLIALLAAASGTVVAVRHRDSQTPVVSTTNGSSARAELSMSVQRLVSGSTLALSLGVDASPAALVHLLGARSQLTTGQARALAGASVTIEGSRRPSYGQMTRAV